MPIPTAETPTHAHPLPGGRDARRRRWKRLAWTMAALSAAAWSMWGFSHAVEWSTFTAGPVRAVAPRPGSPVVPAAGSTTVEERDETHVMFGHGGVFVYSSTRYTQSFAAAPNADANSRVLAWATLDNMFPVYPPWRFHRYPAGPLWGVRLWPVAAIPTALLVLCLVVLRRVAPDGVCPWCRYPRSGLPAAAPCPECGAADERAGAS